MTSQLNRFKHTPETAAKNATREREGKRREGGRERRETREGGWREERQTGEGETEEMREKGEREESGRQGERDRQEMERGTSLSNAGGYLLVNHTCPYDISFKRKIRL